MNQNPFSTAVSDNTPYPATGQSSHSLKFNESCATPMRCWP